MEGPRKSTGQQVLVKHGSTYVRCHPCRLSFVKGPPSSLSYKPLISEVEANSPPDADQNYTSPDSDDNQDGSSSQPDEHVVADDTQEPNHDAIFSGNVPENQNDEGAGTATESSDMHDPVEENIQQDHSNTNAQSVASAKALTRNMDIRYKVEDHDSWKRAKLLSRAGKDGIRRSGKYKNAWNVEDPNGNKLSIDFVKVAVWEEVSNTDEENEEFLFHETCVSQISDEVKLRELKGWKSQRVYDEVDNKNQPCISVRWVIKPKVMDGRLSTKAGLRARGFQELQNFHTDSPTCTRESIRLAFAIISSKGWTLNSIDIKTAFLQGKEIERTVYVKPQKKLIQISYGF